jgi:hypothetical protein
MALPAITAGAARGLDTGRRLTKGAGRVGRRAAEEIKKGPPVERPPVKAAEAPGEEAPDETTRKVSALISPEGVMMMSVGGMLDILSIIGAILILALGTGLLFAKIVYIVGLIIVGSWAFFRSGALPTRGKTKGLVGKKGGRTLTRFLKRQWPKLAGKAVPAVGDALPLWTWTVYSELTSE